MSKGTNIRIDGVKPSYYTQVPNMAFRALSPNAYKLLAVYIDIAKDVDVYASNATVSERLNTSVNTMKKARQELADCGYIKYTAGNEHHTADVVICWNWMWTENYKVMHKVSNSDTPLSNSDTPLSNSDTNQELYNKEPYDKQQTTTAVVDAEVKYVFKHFASVFSLYVNDEKYQASKQPAKDMQSLHDLIAEYGHDSVNLAIEKCIGAHPNKPLPYLTSICRSPDHKAELAKRKEQASIVTPYHQPAVIEDETLLSDDDVQSFLDELRQGEAS